MKEGQIGEMDIEKLIVCIAGKKGHLSEIHNYRSYQVISHVEIDTVNDRQMQCGSNI
ncbi:hypothetical protein LMF89_20585 [Pelosinus sp. Bkl1]|uniref:Uncharacterized protein n=1 Tax=Pelosinus baikalensis TaxID=2892015 RepID=A0ABS8HX52_9FIRM|nr:hypothetical protein [Pelosinus baikalensis]